MELIKQASEIIANGGLVIYPTDTAVGLGCRFDDENAIRRLNKITYRPENQPLPVLVKDTDQAKTYLKPLPAKGEKLMERFWPGGLTIVYWCRLEKVIPLTRGGGQTLGVRVPNHPVPVEMINTAKIPIIGTSANRHRGPTPYSTAELDPELAKNVDLVIPGTCPLGHHSTVVDLTTTPWTIRRQGAVSLDQSWFAPPVRVADASRVGIY